MYRVIWLDRTLDDLALLYVSHPLDLQRRMAAGIEALNRRLARNPLEEGESREGRTRVTFTDLLMIRFWVDTVERAVLVHAVQQYGQ